LEIVEWIASLIFAIFELVVGFAVGLYKILFSKRDANWPS